MILTVTVTPEAHETGNAFRRVMQVDAESLLYGLNKAGQLLGRYSWPSGEPLPPEVWPR
jgi:hypothetical protein